jgi:hypothetical protein
MTPRGRFAVSTHSSRALRFMPICTARDLHTQSDQERVGQHCAWSTHRQRYFFRVSTRLKISPGDGYENVPQSERGDTYKLSSTGPATTVV